MKKELKEALASSYPLMLFFLCSVVFSVFVL